MSGRTMRQRALIGGVAILAVATAGCDRAWHAYRRAELGRPLPEGHLLLTEGARTDRALAWRDWCVLPGIWGEIDLRAMTDDVGRMAAKRYTASALGDWVLCRTFARRVAMDFHVPPDWRAAPSPGWLPDGPTPRGRLYREAKAALSPLVLESPTPRIESEKVEGGDRSPTWFRVSMAPGRLRPEVRKRLALGASVPVDLTRDVDLSGLRRAGDLPFEHIEARVWPTDGPSVMLDVTVLASDERERNVVRHIRETDAGMDAADVPNSYEDVTPLQYLLAILLARAWFEPVMYFGGQASEVDSTMLDADRLRDLARAGFDRTLRLDNGATIRWRNLGDGHVRIEAKWFRIVDPLLWIIKCELASRHERVVQVRSGG